MKKLYETPSVEKIMFNYRDQVVAASAGGTTDPTDPITPSNPTVGSVTNETYGQNGCKWYLFDAWGSSICAIL